MCGSRPIWGNWSGCEFYIHCMYKQKLILIVLKGMVVQKIVHTGITTAFSSWMISAVPVTKLNYRSVHIVPGCSTTVLAMRTFMPEFVVQMNRHLEVILVITYSS